MNNIISIRNIAVAIIIAMMSIACNRSEMDNHIDCPEGEGAIKLSYNISTPQTRASVASPLDNSILRIYQKQEGAYKLIRVNSPATDIEPILYLMSGDYKITLEVGVAKDDAKNATFDKNDLLYYGEKEFNVEANKVTPVELHCKTLYSAVKIIYQKDSLFNAKFDLGASTLVNACDAFTDAAGTPSLEFLKSDTVGYYLLPAGVSNLSWKFTGKSTELGDVIKSDIIENPQAATLYTLTFKYSKNADGILDLTISVYESYDIFYDTYSFSPQPTVLGDGISTPFNFVNAAANFNISSIKPLASVKLSTTHVDGIPYEIVINETSDLTGTGIVYTKIEDKKATLSIEKAFFDKYQFGGAKEIDFVATDDAGAEGIATAKVNITGISEAATLNMWARTMSFKGMIADPAVTTVNVLYKATGDADWTAIAATKAANGTFEVAIAPTWTASKNVANLNVNTFSGGVKVGTQYEYKLQVADTDVLSAYTYTTAAGQAMPYGNFEDGGLKCWSKDASGSTNWGSGNNTFAGGLCQHGTKAGMGGSKCAYLQAGEAAGALTSGNIFLGQFSFGGIVSQEGTVKFGQAFNWTVRPRKLSFKYAAEIGNVNVNKFNITNLPIKVGQKDNARIYFAIVDWSGRHEVTAGPKTNPPKGPWDPEKQTSTSKGNIIGYASFLISDNQANMITQEVEICYHDKVTKPSKNITLVFSGATSAYGDYMLGCNSNKVWIDDIEFVY